jgi:hypothetical protein
MRKKSVIPKDASVRIKSGNGRPKTFKGLVKDKLGFFTSWVLKPEYQRVKQLDYNVFLKSGFKILSAKSHMISNWTALHPISGRPVTNLKNKDAYSNIMNENLKGLVDVDGNPITFSQRTYIQNKIKCDNTPDFKIRSKKDLVNMQKFLEEADANTFTHKLICEFVPASRKCIFELVDNETVSGSQKDLMLTAIEDKKGNFIPVNEFKEKQLYINIGCGDNGDHREVIHRICEKENSLRAPKAVSGCIYSKHGKQILKSRKVKKH